MVNETILKLNPNPLIANPDERKISNLNDPRSPK